MRAAGQLMGSINLCSFQLGALKGSMGELQTEGVLISFRTLGCRLRYAQVQINISTRFSSNFGQQLPVICARLEVRHGLSTIAFDRGLVISPCSLYFAVE